MGPLFIGMAQFHEHPLNDLPLAGRPGVGFAQQFFSRWTTAQWAAALPAILEYCQYNTYSFFQGKTFIDYADNTYDDAPGYDYTPVKG